MARMFGDVGVVAVALPSLSLQTPLDFEGPGKGGARALGLRKAAPDPSLWLCGRANVRFVSQQKEMDVMARTTAAAARRSRGARVDGAGRGQTTFLLSLSLTTSTHSHTHTLPTSPDL